MTLKLIFYFIGFKIIHKYNNITIMNTAEIREDFIKFFRSKKHKYLAPSKVFIDDPTLFFVNAGMNQLKDIFLNKKTYDEKFSMLTNCQTCIRAGGKHNDLDDVGKDTYHLTSFEMLGNWSLNQYWKEEVIQMAFEYLTTRCNFDVNRMYVTYFEGNKDWEEDCESKNIWKKYLPEDHIVPGSFKDNFWMMGLTGPCGASSEIHYDLELGRTSAKNLVNVGDPSLIEVWNLVFMEYNAVEDENANINYIKLDKRFVDCGMGLSRLAMIMQNKRSIYQTDIFQKLMCYVEIVSNCEKYTDTYEITNKKDIAYRIFTDHIRTCVTAIYDGVSFDCFGRGFILRKIFRRLLTNYYVYLNNCVVKQVTKHHIFNALITEVLVFHNLFNHDSEKIRKILDTEELLYIGKINKFKNGYNTKIKQSSSENVIKKYLDNYDVIKSQDGMDVDIIQNIDKISFS